MFQNKSSSFGVRPRATGRQVALSNENSNSNSIITRSQAIKDTTKDVKLSAKPSLVPKQVLVSNISKSAIPNSKLLQKNNIISNDVVSSKPKQSLTSNKEFRNPRLLNSNPSVVVTRSRSVSGVSSELTSKNSATSTRAVRPVKKISNSTIISKTSVNRLSKDPIKSNTSKSTLTSEVIGPRRIAKPSSLYESRRSQFSKSSASLDSLSKNDSTTNENISTAHAIRRSATSLSSVGDYSNNQIIDDNSSLKLTSSNIKLSSLRISSSNSQSTITSSGQTPSLNTMDIDACSDITNVAEAENDIDTELDEDDILVEISDDESSKIHENSSRTKISNYERNDAISYALSHTGLLNEMPITIEEIQRFESDVEPFDTSLVPDFSDDIFLYMREVEAKFTPCNQYMDRQPELAWSMRYILVDWLVQVHDRFRLLPETLFLAINFVDRFLSLKTVKMHKLQLVGAVSLLLAAKYEEIQFPSVSEIVYMTENAYTSDEVTKAERFILRMLNFDLGWPGPMSFLRRISKADDYDISTRTLSKYLLEVTLMDEYFIAIPCSQIAAISHYISLRLLNKGSWTREHAFYSGYFESEIAVHIPRLLETLMFPKKHQAIYDKYSDRKYMRSSEYVAQWFLRNDYKSLLKPHQSDLSPL
ncbi:G2/mitotic-specific cyclin-4 [Smittium culicis]|uniref:G2/mitotic-specific cyclin-4 n=1 Tax=Smittium culicis TaxID=133412 RepID=A0A1R1XDG6_9FUNG|nr:G2/mitotic-specific cyclin-4 [Smittium culicis]OMJ12667.1 G2/mitotic-specific cyclin-4 [Smittium culicis]OMJ15152.1 G2/mitotic-specific cyclin-4 [Smittium culicis]